MVQLLRWPVVVLLVAVGLAYLYRYDAVTQLGTNAPTTVVVWDRWGHRVCVAYFLGLSGLYCDAEKWRDAAAAADQAAGAAADEARRGRESSPRFVPDAKPKEGPAWQRGIVVEPEKGK